MIVGKINILLHLFFQLITYRLRAIKDIVLAVGLSGDYSAHVGHCFMTKIGSRNKRIKKTLADIGMAVLSGLTVGFGILHGLVLLPVMLSLVGPDP